MSDPFFDLTENSTWNACIGVQGHPLHYADGYLEAAIELADAILQKKLFGKRDTLVLPILYNARHAVELTQKFVIATLHQSGALAQSAPIDHNIKAHWTRLNDKAIGDEALRAAILALEPYVMSLARVDDDGQSLRYAVRQDGQKSMEDKWLANILVIRASLASLDKILSELKGRVIDYAEERATGTFTKECSRKDLFVIAKALPQKADWHRAEFDVAKEAMQNRFALSGRKFSEAVDVIKASREMKAIIGIETPLAYLSDDDLVFVIDQWQRLYPADRVHSPLGTDYFDPVRIEAMVAHDEIAEEVYAALLAYFTVEKVADLQTIFYMGRDHIPGEFYETCLQERFKVVRVEGLPSAVRHLMEKTNLQTAIPDAAKRLGRLRLADQLAPKRD